MKTVLHTAQSRGHAFLGWLDSYHSFSFGQFHDSKRMHFGVLRVLNDDTVSGGRGFGFHPHDNMEIISIPLEGDLEHKDSMGSNTVIRSGDVQVMSAGTGIVHSEYNKNKDAPVKFLQIWIMPSKPNVKPRYQQITLGPIVVNELTQIVSPLPESAGVWVHQDAWIHWGNFNKNVSTSYQLKKPGNGVYVFILKGALEVNGKVLHPRDAYGMWDMEQFEIKVNDDSSFLIIDVPMEV